MKVLGIMGSPRIGGNTDLLLDEALKGAENQQAEAEKIRKIGEAEAAVIEAMGKAEAERMKLKAEAYQKYGDAAKMALVLEALPHRYRLIFPQILLEVFLPAPASLRLSPGDTVLVRLDRVLPREDQVKVSLA